MDTISENIKKLNDKLRGETVDNSEFGTDYLKSVFGIKDDQTITQIPP